MEVLICCLQLSLILLVSSMSIRKMKKALGMSKSKPESKAKPEAKAKESTITVEPIVEGISPTPVVSDPIMEDREDTNEAPKLPSAEERDADTPRNSPKEFDSIIAPIASPKSPRDEESIVTETKPELKQESDDYLWTVNEEPSKEAEEEMAAAEPSMNEDLTMDNTMSQDGDYPDNSPAFCGCFTLPL